MKSFVFVCLLAAMVVTGCGSNPVGPSVAGGASVSGRVNNDGQANPIENVTDPAGQAAINNAPVTTQGACEPSVAAPSTASMQGNHTGDVVVLLFAPRYGNYEADLEVQRFSGGNLWQTVYTANTRRNATDVDNHGGFTPTVDGSYRFRARYTPTGCKGVWSDWVTFSVNGVEPVDTGALVEPVVENDKAKRYGRKK